MSDALLDSALAEGEAVIDRFLARASELDAIIRGPGLTWGMTLEQIEAEFAKEIMAAVASADKKKPGLNAKVDKIAAVLREQAAAAINDFTAAEMWLTLKTPAVSDGNNFGVEVQHYAKEALQKMRTSLEGMIDAPSGYHWARATGLEKLSGGTSKESSNSESSETAEAKTEVKKSSSSKTTVKDEPQIEDFAAYIAALDTKHYHTVYRQMLEVKNSYLKAHLLFSKNLKRLADPRGDGEGERSNVMSMF